jgi:uncharacterized protein (TIGR02145 family)
MNKTITLILSIMLKSFTAHLVKRPFMGVLTIAVIMVLTNCGGGGGNEDYYPSTGTSKCNGESYDPSVYSCESGELIGKCKGEDYYAAYEQCVNGVIVPGSSLSSGGSSVVSSSSTGSSSNNGSSSSKGSSSSVNGSSSSSSATGVDLCNGFADGTEREHYGMMKEQFCDSRDGKKYFYVEIGDQTWMAENLNYNVSGSKCGSTLSGTGTLSDADATACDTYGRLYNWNTAMGGATSSIANPSGVQGVCPSDWHLPSYAEWNELIDYVENDKGCTSCAGKYLKATSGWKSSNGIVNLDSYGFLG